MDQFPHKIFNFDNSISRLLILPSRIPRSPLFSSSSLPYPTICIAAILRGRHSRIYTRPGEEKGEEEFRTIISMNHEDREFPRRQGYSTFSRYGIRGNAASFAANPSYRPALFIRNLFTIYSRYFCFERNETPLCALPLLGNNSGKLDGL